MAFIRKEIETLELNPFTAIGNGWFLLTSGTEEDYNTMTCSWGAMGEIWNAPSLTAYVRTSRYTFDFIEKKCIVYCQHVSGTVQKGISLLRKPFRQRLQ